MNLTPEELGKAMRTVRLAAGLTQRDMGAQLGISQAAVSTYEIGVSVPPLDKLSRWAEACNTTVGIIFGDPATPLAAATAKLNKDDMALLIHLAGVLSDPTAPRGIAVRGAIEALIGQPASGKAATPRATSTG